MAWTRSNSALSSRRSSLTCGDSHGGGRRRGATRTTSPRRRSPYRLSLTGAARDALAALPAGQTAWFELEHPEEVSSIDVWVAGDLIHRITVDQGPRDATVEFFDFGRPVEITAPPGV